MPVSRCTRLVITVAAALLLLPGCDEEALSTTPNVSFEVVSTGRQLLLTWDEIEDADSYRIAVDDSVLTDTLAYFFVGRPAKLLEVAVFIDGVPEEPWVLDCRPVVTSEVRVFGTSAAGEHHGLGFSDGGYCQTYALDDSFGRADIDYVFDDQTRTPEFHVFSPRAYEPRVNDRDNTLLRVGGGGFDEMQLVPDSAFEASARCEPGLYCCWVDERGNGWDDEDRFAKVEILSVDGAEVLLKTACQPIGGLRWLRTDD